MTETVSKQSYDLSELENSNLRKHLAWTGQYLTTDQCKELARRIRGPLEAGGVVEDSDEENWEYVREIKRLCVKAAELLREVDLCRSRHEPLSTELSDLNWFARAEDLANKLIEFDPPSVEAGLAVIRNTDEVEKKFK
jgi:hypothetical protein